MDVQLVGRDDDVAMLLGDVAAGRHVLLTGEAGVGKSRLLAETADRASAAGHRVTRLVGYPSSRRVPFGAVAHLLDETAPSHRALLLARLRARLTSTDVGPRPLVAVDDIDELDDETHALVVSLASTDDAIVVATCRTSALRDDRVARLWTEGLVRQRDIEPLDEAATTELAAALLGGKPSRTLAGRLWQVSRGHPLFVRELVLAGRASGAVAPTDGHWSLAGALPVDGRLTDLVAARTDRLSEQAAAALATVAMTQPMDVRTLALLASPAALAELERHDLLRVRRAGRSPDDRPLAEVAHPLIGRVVSDRLGHFGRRQVLERVVEVVGAHTDGRDALRQASWLLEIDRVPDAGLATAAAREALARFDHELAARLAATVMPPTSESLMLAARAAAGLGRIEEAVDGLERAVAMAADDDERQRATAAMIEVVGLVAGDVDGALEGLRDAIAATTDEHHRRELEIRGLLVAGLAGRFSDALALADETTLTPASSSVEAHALMALTLAQAMTGSLAGVDERVDRALVLAERVRLEEPYLVEQVGLNRVLVRHAQARLPAASILVADRLAGRSDHGVLGPWLFVDTPGLLLAGDLATAERRTAESHELLLGADPLGVRGLAAAFAAVVAGLRGSGTVATWVERAEAVQRLDEVRIAGWLAMAGAWRSAWTGDPDAGAREARAGGLAAIDGEHAVWGAMALHTATRLDRAHEVVEDLDRVTGAGPLVALLVRHTRAAAAHDRAGLSATATAFEQCGAAAVAAETWTQVARLSSDDAVGHARAALRAHELAARCDDLRCWLLQDLPVPVTDRQQQVGRLAAAGLPSRAIAARLDITSKTVDNHLQRLYGRLDIAGRRELALVFP